MHVGCLIVHVPPQAPLIIRAAFEDQKGPSSRSNLFAVGEIDGHPVFRGQIGTVALDNQFLVAEVDSDTVPGRLVASQKFQDGVDTVNCRLAVGHQHRIRFIHAAHGNNVACLEQ